jgi:universal stress protein E
MNKLLIVADPEGKCYATPRGLELAASLKLEVDIVAFVNAPLRSLDVSTAQQEKIKKMLMRDQEATVRERVKEHAAKGQKVNVIVEWTKDAMRWINSRCASGNYYAVVKTGGADGARVAGSDDWQLLRECRAPVLLVAEHKWSRTKPVLVTVDLPSDSRRKRALNRKVLEAGKALAEALDAPLEIITAIEVPVLLAELDIIDPASYAAEAKESMQPQVNKLAREMNLPAKLFKAKRGPVEKVITSRAAKVRAQIVVMGTAGRTGVKARLLGNTAEKVLEHLHTDVLAIKP